MKYKKSMYRCDHLHSTKVRDAQWVYGTPGILPAQYRCVDCGIWWDDPSESPPEGQSWTHVEGPEE